MTRTTLATLAGTLLLTASACATTGAGDPAAAGDAGAATAEDGTSSGHGAVEGAQEVAEPQLHLVSIAPDGGVGMLDLRDETSTEPTTIGQPGAVASDGRYVFASTPAGLEIVDSGVWTWDHGDHFHYYRAEPELLGTLAGSGAATVSPGALSTAGGTGVFFPETGQAVLLDNQALADGEILESFRLDGRTHDGLAAPLGDGALVSVPDGAGAVTAVRFHGADGEPVDGAQAPCREARGSITTRVGLVVGCADGALLITEEGGNRPSFETIPYPDRAAAPRATSFQGRKGRPTVAARSGRSGIWLLDTRERTWQHLETDVPLLRVSAADDEEGHVLALDRTGRVRVYAADSGEQLAVTEPLLRRTLRERDLLAGVDLVVDQHRAYLNAPAEAVVYEIDYADSARIARVLEPPTVPTFFTEAGR